MNDDITTEFQAPPPEKIEPPEQAEMSEPATIFNVFLEPGRVFEDLRKKPRFIIGGLIIAILVTGYAFGLRAKFGEDGIRRFALEQLDKNPRTADLTKEQKENAIDLQLKIGGYVRYAIPIFVFVTMLLGGLLYWLAAKAFGGDGGFLNNVSVFIYSGIPPAVVSMIANFLVLYFKSTDEIDLATSQSSVIHANPAMFMDGKAMPLLATLVGTLDLFTIWGWILAAIGLRKVNKLKSGSAWAIVFIFAFVGVIFRLVGAYFSGNAN